MQRGDLLPLERMPRDQWTWAWDYFEKHDVHETPQSQSQSSTSGGPNGAPGESAGPSSSSSNSTSTRKQRRQEERKQQRAARRRKNSSLGESGDDAVDLTSESARKRPKPDVVDVCLFFLFFSSCVWCACVRACVRVIRRDEETTTQIKVERECVFV